MTRNEALAIATETRKAHMAADSAAMFGRGPKINDADYGYRHGWYTVGDFSFNTDDITGQQYDPNQAGWAWI